jgi:hypothetical protein
VVSVTDPYGRINHLKSGQVDYHRRLEPGAFRMKGSDSIQCSMVMGANTFVQVVC